MQLDMILWLTFWSGGGVVVIVDKRDIETLRGTCDHHNV